MPRRTLSQLTCIFFVFQPCEALRKERRKDAHHSVTFFIFTFVDSYDLCSSCSCTQPHMQWSQGHGQQHTVGPQEVMWGSVSDSCSRGQQTHCTAAMSRR